MNSPRILVVGDAGNIHTRRWVEGLAGRGLDVAVLSPTGGGLDPRLVISSAVPDWRPWRPRRYFGRYRSVFLGAVERFRPDLIHLHSLCHDAIPEGPPGGPPLVISTWGSDVDPPGDEPEGERARKVALLRSARLVLASSAYLRDVTARYAGLRPDRVRLLYWGVDLVRFAPPPRPCDRPVIGFAKHLRRIYGPDTLIASLPEVIAAIPEARLIMIGRGDEEGALKGLADRLGVGHAIEWAGHVDHREMPGQYARMAISVMPSRREALGVAALESQAMGVPVVATRVGGIPEVVVDGETGRLVPPDDPSALADAIKALLADAAPRHRLGAQGRARVEARFDWDRSLSDTIDLYRRFAPGGTPAPAAEAVGTESGRPSSSSARWIPWA